MGQELVTVDLRRWENVLAMPEVRDPLADMLGPVGIPVESFTRTALIATSKSRDLQECSLESWVAAVTSLAVVRLLPDGLTGQSFLTRFNNKGVPTVVPIIGYKGYNTLAARVGRTLTSGLVREGDDFDYELGSRAFVRHRPRLDRGAGRPIIAAWALAAAPGLSDIISVMPIDDLEAVAQKYARPGSPWRDEVIGRPAMMEKTAKRRLGRHVAQDPTIPLGRDFARAAALEERIDEMGQIAYLKPDGDIQVVDSSPDPAVPALEDMTSKQAWTVTLIDGREQHFVSEAAWRMRWSKIIETLAQRPSVLRDYRDANVDHFTAAGRAGEDVKAMINRAIGNAPRGSDS
jgi:phage RecT family recombinase